MSVWIITRNWTTDCDCCCDKMEIKAVCTTKEKAEEVLESMKQSHIQWCMTRSWSKMTKGEALIDWERDLTGICHNYSIDEYDTDLHLDTD